MKKSKVSIKELICELLRISKKLGKRSFSCGEFRKAKGKYEGPILKKLGWIKAMKKANLSSFIGYNLSKRVLIEELLRISKKLTKKSFFYDEFREAGGKYASAIKEKLGRGSWNKALLKVGLESGLEMNIPKRQLIVELIRISKKLSKKYFTMNEFIGAGGRNYEPAKRKLGRGSWPKALMEAGLISSCELYIPEKDITETKMIVELLRISKKLGKKSFSRFEFRKAGGKYSVVIDRKLGWNKALLKAGLEVFLDRNINDEKMIAELLRISQKLGKNSFSRDEFRKAGGKYEGSILQRLGWNQALIKAGLFPQISNEIDFVDACQTHEAVRATVEAFNGNEADIVNVLSIISSGKWSRKKMEHWMRRPKLSKWIGKFKKPNLDPKAILEAGFKLMPYEKNGIIKDLLLKQLLAWVDQERGLKPTKAEKLNSIKKLEVYVKQLKAA